MIGKTLVIGLGSTGAHVLASLADRVYEQYLVRELPVFQTMAVVTSPADRKGLAKRGVRCLAIDIESCEAIAQRIRMPSSDVDRALGAWLPQEVLETASYKSGSGNKRAVGRLHLWRNINTIKNEIVRAHALCVSPDAENRSNAVIHQRFVGGGIGVPQQYVEPGGGARVYVVGSLCGGTCSGMINDLGFLVKGLAGVTLDSVVGVFTVVDTASCGNRDVLAVNCRAAISELEYYHRVRETVFEDGPCRVLPDGGPMPEGPPYDTLYVVSTTNIDGQRMVKAADGDVDVGALEDMVALKLFLEVCGEAGAELADFHGDLPIQAVAPDHLYLRRPRMLYSFGAAAFAYPRYRIATAAACALAGTAVGRWVDAPAEEGGALEAASEDFYDLRQALRRELGEEALLADVSDACRTSLAWNAASAASLRNALERLGGGDGDVEGSRKQALRERILERRGTYYVRLKDAFNVSAKRRGVAMIVEGYRRQRYSTRSVKSVECYLGEMLIQLKRREAELEKGLDPAIPLSDEVLQGRLRVLERVEQSDWLAMVGVRFEACRERRMHVMERYEVLAKRAVRLLVDDFELMAIDSCVKEVERLQSLVAELREGMVLVCRAWRGIREKVMQQLESPPSGTMYLFVTESANGDVDGQSVMADEKVDEILVEGVLDGMLWSHADAIDRFDAALNVSIDREVELLALNMMEPVRQEILENMREVAVDQGMVGRIRRLWGARFNATARHAYPHIEFNVHYTNDVRRLPNPGPTALVVAAGEVEDILAATVQQEGFPVEVGGLDYRDNRWKALSVEQLDHQVILYVEEPRIASSYLEMCDLLDRDLSDVARANNLLLWTDAAWETHGGPRAFDAVPLFDLWLQGSADVLSVGGTRWREVPDVEPHFLRLRYPDDNEGPYVTVPRGEYEVPIEIEVGDLDSYRAAIDSGESSDLLRWVEGRVVACAQSLGLRECCDRAAAVLELWRGERAERRRETAWSEEDEAAFLRQEKRVTSYLAAVKVLAFHREDISPNELDLLSGMGIR